ncbi:UrcA family protein [Sphingomonas sp. HITSZ_GF]|uniref:UrcA family protein n=1 Tax=Sphingomonas sp. HITSZ_GF TaxID=3037247 RepID=UPI00240E97D0|nr:UrcA family protein [Sphingomonas sp. HITSZ_GF]MDG2533129.1 UrcA family protein [Sphingomonas sp. HITSZ_GF]
MMKTLIPLALILSPAAIPLAAKAQQADAGVRVSYADLDLSRAADRAALDRRLARALDRACPVERPGYLTQSPEALRCQALARQQIAEARQQALAQRSGAVRISANP